MQMGGQQRSPLLDEVYKQERSKKQPSEKKRAGFSRPCKAPDTFKLASWFFP